MAELTARDIMTRDLVTVSSETSVTDAASVMVDAGVRVLPVLDDGELVGLVTEDELIAQDIKREYPTYVHLLDGFVTYPPSTAHFQHELKNAVAASVGDVMTSDPVTVQVGSTVEDVAEVMLDRKVSTVPVLDGATLVGIVSKSDILRAIVGGRNQ